MTCLHAILLVYLLHDFLEVPLAVFFSQLGLDQRLGGLLQFIDDLIGLDKLLLDPGSLDPPAVIIIGILDILNFGLGFGLILFLLNNPLVVNRDPLAECVLVLDLLVLSFQEILNLFPLFGNLLLLLDEVLLFLPLGLISLDQADQARLFIQGHFL